MTRWPACSASTANARPKPELTPVIRKVFCDVIITLLLAPLQEHLLMTRMKCMSISAKIAASFLRSLKCDPFSAKRCVCLEQKNPQEERRSGCVYIFHTWIVLSHDP